MFTSSLKREIRNVRVVVVQKRAEKCIKKHGVRAKLLFANQTYCVFFLTFSLPSASLDLKVPTNGGKRTRVLLAGDFHDTCYLKWADLRLQHSQILVHFLRQGKAK